MVSEEKFAARYRIDSARWAGYDYGQNGIYFVTICTKNQQRFFGEIELPTGRWDEARLRPMPQAALARECWEQIPARFPFVVLDEFIIMPDHLHGLLQIDKAVEEVPALRYQNQFGPQRENLAAVIRGFKAGVSAAAKRAGLPFEWQSRYHDRVVRNADETERIRQYIAANPSHWQHEQFQEEGIFR